MSATKLFYGVFLCTILTSSTLDHDNPLKFLARVSLSIVDIGRTTQCLAHKGDSSEIKTKIYDAFDTTFAELKKNVDGPLELEKFVVLLRVLLMGATENLKSIDPQCHGYCTEDNVDYALKEVGDAGKAAEALGLTLSCMLDDPRPEVLGQFADVVGSGWQSIAATTDSSKTSVGIVLPEVAAILKGLQKLSSRCVNIKGIC